MTRNQFKIDTQLNFQYIFGVSDNIDFERMGDIAQG